MGKYTPTARVSNMKVKRDGGMIIGTWKVPSEATASGKDNPFKKLHMKWRLHDDVKKKKDPTDTDKTGDARGTTNGQTIGEFKGTFKPYAKKPLERKAFWPYTKVNVEKFSLMVRGVNVVRGKSFYGPWSETVAFKFAEPYAPKIDISFDESTRDAVIRVTQDPDLKGSHEWARTTVAATVTNRNGKKKPAWTDKKGKAVNSKDTESTDATFRVALSEHLANIKPGENVTVTVKATAGGYAGSTESTEKLVVGMPGIPTIKNIKVDSLKPKGKVTVVIGAKKLAGKLQLQRRHDMGNPEDVSAPVDDDDCKTLHDNIGAIWPNGRVPGERVYYRLHSMRDGYESFSKWVEAEKLYTTKPVSYCTATVVVGSVNRDVGASTATVNIYFKDGSKNLGTELSWSDWNGAWNSPSAPPQTLTYDGSGAADKSMSGCDKRHSLPMSGIEAGKTYYIKARRYLKIGDEYFYSDYSKTFNIKFSDENMVALSQSVYRIVSAKSGDSATVYLKYSGAMATKGVEVSWSTNGGAWDGGGSPESAPYARDGAKGVNDFPVTIGKGGIGNDLEPGTKYYVRARAYAVVNGQTVYGSYSSAMVFTTDSAADDPCNLVYCESDPDGLGATLVVGHTDDGNTGTIVEWSPDEFAWKSNKGPDSVEASWADDSPRKSTLWAKTQSVYLRGTELGKVYYVKARRYSDAGGIRQLGPVCDTRTFNTVAATAVDDACAVLSITPDEHSTGAYVVIGWNENNANDGTEVSWSSNADAWESSQQPNTMQATWKDDVSRSQDWGGTQQVHIRGLTPGSTLHVRARRYESQAGTFSPMSDALSAAIPSIATSLGLLCGVVSAETVDGDTVRLVVGWTGDRTGCEVTWSDDPNAWESSVRPSSMEFDWADERNQSAFKTEDVEVDPDKTYYTRTGTGTVEDPYVYEPVANPVVSELDTYFEFAWAATGTVYLSELTEGTTYYVRARSYYEGDSKVYSGMGSAISVTPITAPTTVALSAPEAVAKGDAIELFWTVEHPLEQTEWYAHLEGVESTSLASGEGSLCRATITPEQYADATSLAIQVRAGCGGETTESNVVNVNVATAPACECACAPVLAEQPASVEIYTDDPTSSASVTCRSQGITFEAPDGERGQLPGDVVWTSAESPQWTQATWADTILLPQLSQASQDAADAYSDALEAATFELTEDTEVVENKSYYEPSGGSYTRVVPESDPSAEGLYEIPDEEEALAADNARTTMENAQAALAAHPSDGEVYIGSVSLPTDAVLYDGGEYELSVTASESVAGLTSAVATCSFDVAFAHQAPTPSDCTLEIDEEDRTATITVNATEEFAEGDTIEVYRMTGTGHVLVRGNVSPGATVIDDYAPFGDAHYRVACRTDDGDVAFADFGYSLPVKALRFDWGNESVELPYNVELSDAYEKSFEARDHVDGSVNGYYDKAVHRTGSYKASIVKADSDTVTALKRLGEHHGAVFCRTSSGEAFQANVDLGGIDVSYATMAAGVTFPVTEMKLTEQFMAREDEG